MRSSYRLAPAQTLQCLASVAALLVIAVGASADEVQKHFDAGVKLYHKNKNEEALVEFSQALKGAPKDPNILRWVGFLQLERQNYAAARDPLEQAVALDPESVVAHLNLGNVYDGLKLFPKALDEFRKVTKLKPDSADGFYDMGLIQSKLGHWSDAAESLRTAVRLDAAMTARPNAGGRKEDPAIDDALGYALLNNGDSHGAAAAYQKAVSLAPDNAEFNYHLGLAWRRVADDRKTTRKTALNNSRRALKVAVDHAPANYEYVELYAEVLFDLNSNGEAADQFARAASLDKSQYNPVYNMAVAYSRLGRNADAEKAYARALALAKSDEPSLRRNALNGLTISLYRQKKYDEAITTLKTFIKDFPSDTVGWVNLAAAYRYKSDEAAQVEALRGAIANGAGYANIAQIHAALGSLYYKRDEAAAALEQYLIANRLQPNSAEFLNGLALTEEKAGRVDDAIRDFMAAVRNSPRFADAYNNLGVAYESRYRASKDKADLEHALASYNQALAIDPQHALARRNKDRFDRARKP